MAEARNEHTRRRGRRIPSIATVAALALVLPIAVLVGLVAWDNGPLDAAEAEGALVAYAAILLAFTAAIRFGHAVRISGVPPAALAAIAAPLVGLAALFLPTRPALALLALAIAASGAVDVWGADRGTVPAWYGRLRLWSAPLAVLLIVAGFVLAGT